MSRLFYVWHVLRWWWWLCFETWMTCSIWDPHIVVAWYAFVNIEQADRGSPVTVGLSGPGAFPGLLVLLLPKISACQRRQQPAWSRPRVSFVCHTLPGEGGHRWRYERTHFFKNSFFWSSDSLTNIFCLFVCVAARKLSVVGELPGANVKSYAGYFTVNKKYNSNLFFWFIPALKVRANFSFPSYTIRSIMTQHEKNEKNMKSVC